MNSRTFGVMVALALAAIIMLTVLLDFVTAHAAPIRIERSDPGFITDVLLDDGYDKDSWVSVGDKVILNYVFEYTDRWNHSLQWNLEIFGVNGFVFYPIMGMVGYSHFFDPSTMKYYDHDFDQAQLLWTGHTPSTDKNIYALTGFYTMAGTIGGEMTGTHSVIAELSYPSTLDGSYGFSFATAPVPEPTTALLFGVGLLGITSIIRRKM